MKDVHNRRKVKTDQDMQFKLTIANMKGVCVNDVNAKNVNVSIVTSVNSLIVNTSNINVTDDNVDAS